MCFTIPIKIKKLAGDKAIIEDGSQVKLEAGLNVHPGDFVRVSGGVIVDRIQAKQALKIRQLIKRLNDYE